MNFLGRKKTEVPTQASYRPKVSQNDRRLGEQLHQPKPEGQLKPASGNGKMMKILLVVLFIVGLSAYNIWLIIRCFYSVPAKPMNMGQIVTPLSHSPFEGKWFDGEIDQDAHHKIIAFKDYMDSLSRSSEGRAEYDRVMAARPGLMDSLLLYERTIDLQIPMPLTPNGQNVNPKN